MYIKLSLSIDQSDYDGLISGERIAILFSPFPIGRQFILVPLIKKENTNPEFWSNAMVRVVDKEIIDPDKINDSLLTLLNLSLEDLKVKISKNDSLMLMYFRVYLLQQPVKVLARNTLDFAPLASEVFIKDPIPLISDQLFTKRQEQFKNGQLSKDSELEKLQITITKLSVNNYAAKSLSKQIQDFLGWQENQPVKVETKHLDWIKTITTLGDRSIEKKNTYQAGTDFENIAKQGLEFLGFTIDESHKGGAGGLDLFCSKPYPLTGECKAGKSIPNHTVEELIRLGGTHLGVEGFINLSAKLVIGAGNPTNPMLVAAYQWKVSIIKAMTLQKLVELKAKYDGAINLFELKKYLQAGQIDEEIDKYIQEVEGKIKLRSKIVEAVKELIVDLDSEKPTAQDVKVHSNATFARNYNPKLGDRLVYEILIELSSPLAGYLGRFESDGIKGDRFYYLRDLPCDT